ncbi:hypothetical protein HanIR_Chr04g0199771 [Helianthus annuus]|nr:hypothetical protein HanIR_Chr04g0199771 [Helianthus annuus]
MHICNALGDFQKKKKSFFTFHPKVFDKLLLTQKYLINYFYPKHFIFAIYPNFFYFQFWSLYSFHFSQLFRFMLLF